MNTEQIFQKEVIDMLKAIELRFDNYQTELNLSMAILEKNNEALTELLDTLKEIK